MYQYRKLSAEDQLALCRERTSKGHPRHAPPHAYEHGGWFLITAATYERAPRFSRNEDRAWLLDELNAELTQHEVRASAWVVLPNRYHLLVQVEQLRVVSDVARKVHARTSRELNRRDHVTGRQVWYRFSDRSIRSERHYRTTLNYIHHNPVKHGYVALPAEWAASSVHWYLEQWSADALNDLWRDYPVLAYGKGWDD